MNIIATMILFLSLALAGCTVSTHTIDGSPASVGMHFAAGADKPHVSLLTAADRSALGKLVRRTAR